MGEWGLGYVLGVVVILVVMFIPLAITRRYDISLPSWIFLPMTVLGSLLAYAMGFVGWWFVGFFAILSLASITLRFTLQG